MMALSILSLTVSAQIQRQFMGQTLGESTKSEVFKGLEDKGAFNDHTIVEETISVNNIRFGGYTWSVAMFMFYENKLITVLFLDFEDSSKIKWDGLVNKLSSKYEKYKTDDVDNSKTYIDERTYLNIRTNDGRITLGYSDLELAKKKNHDEEDEL